MKIHDVLANEMIQLGVMPGTPVLVEVEVVPTVTKVFEACGVADRGVQPYVKIFVVGAGNPETEVRCISGYIPVSQSGIEPFLKLGDNSLFKICRINPVTQVLFVFAQFEKVMLRFTRDRLRTR